jgi:hypothetical protein
MSIQPGHRVRTTGASSVRDSDEVRLQFKLVFIMVWLSFPLADKNLTFFFLLEHLEL